MLVTDRQRAVESRAVSAAWTAAAALAFATALFMTGQVRIPLPFTPVPITLQTLVVFLGGAWLAPRVTVVGVGAFVGAAAVGLPVLSGWRGGLASVFGPTGGYVVGWMLAVYLLGCTLGGRRASVVRIATLMSVAAGLIYTCGVLHLTLLLRVPLVGPGGALWLGLWPFVPGAVIKLVAATIAYRRWPAPFAGR